MTSGPLASTRAGPPRAAATGPWDRTNLGRATLLIAVGALVWFIGWYQVASKASSDEQTTPLNLAIVGVLLAGAGQLSWILDGRRAVGRRRRRLIGDGHVPSAVAKLGTDPELTEVSLVGGRRYYHRPGCALAAGRDLETAARGEHEAAGRSACGVCAP